MCSEKIGCRGAEESVSTASIFITKGVHRIFRYWLTKRGQEIVTIVWIKRIYPKAAWLIGFILRKTKWVLTGIFIHHQI